MRGFSFFLPAPVSWRRRHQAILALIAVYLLLGVVAGFAAVVALDGPEDRQSSMGHAGLIMGASFLLLAEVGALFGTAGNLNVKKSSEKDVAWLFSKRDLELFADWATKMLIGGIFAVILFAPSLGSRLSAFLTLGSPESSQGERVGMLVAIYFGTAGFLAGYILARRFALEGQRSSLVEEGLRLALTLPFDSTRWRGLTEEQNRAIEAVARTPRQGLRNPRELHAWARVQAALGDRPAALAVYDELHRQGYDAEVPREIETLTQATGVPPPSSEQESSEEEPPAPPPSPGSEDPASPGPNLLPSEAIGKMYEALYEPPPEGFRKVIELGERFSDRVQSATLWAYLACAYGQQHRWTTEVEPNPESARGAADRAYFCVQQAIDLDPTWRAPLRSFWNPSSPGGDNDLVTLHDDARFAALLDTDSAGKPAVSASDIRAAFTAPLGVRYEGTLAVWLALRDGSEPESPEAGTYRVAAGSDLRLVAQFFPAGQEAGRAGAAVMLSGEERPSAEFVLRPDSTDLEDFTPDSLTVAAPIDAPSKQPDFSFRAPGAPGRYELWLYVEQGGRTAQIAKLKIEVR